MKKLLPIPEPFTGHTVRGIHPCISSRMFIVMMCPFSPDYWNHHMTNEQQLQWAKRTKQEWSYN